ncbi:Lactate-binding periplasmic protein [subsurface metagenome]
MKRKRLLTLLGSVCLAVMLLVPLAVSCGPATPEAAEEEIAALESEIDELEGDVAAKDAEISDLEDEIAALRAPAEVYEWRLQDSYGATMTGWRLDPLVADIYEMSNGQIKITTYPDGSLIPVEEIPDALEEGIVEMGVTYSGYYSDKIPCFSCADAAFSWQSGDDVEVVWNLLGVADIWRDAWADLGCYYLGPHMGSQCYLISTKPVETLEDLTKLKIRAIAAQAIWLEELGASSIYYPASELYTSLSRGIIDGLIYGGAVDAMDMGWFEVAKYVLKPSVIYPTVDDYIIGLDLWNSLPESLQTIITAAVVKNSRFCYLEYQEGEFIDLAKARDEMGVTVNELSPEDAAKLMVAVAKQWDVLEAQSERSAQVMDIMKGWLRTQGRL